MKDDYITISHGQQGDRGTIGSRLMEMARIGREIVRFGIVAFFGEYS